MIDGILDIVNKFIPDKDKAKELEAQVQSKYVDSISKIKSNQADIIKMEMNSKAGNWRPRLMYLCMFMIGSHYFLDSIVPYFMELFGKGREDQILGMVLPRMEPLSPELWSFVKLGIGGYVGSRSLEKIADRVTKNMGRK